RRAECRVRSVRDLDDAQEYGFGRDIECFPRVENRLDGERLREWGKRDKRHDEFSSRDIAECLQLPVVAREVMIAGPIADTFCAIVEQGMRDFMCYRILHSSPRPGRVELDPRAVVDRDCSRIPDIIARHYLNLQTFGEVQRVERGTTPACIHRCNHDLSRAPG